MAAFGLVACGSDVQKNPALSWQACQKFECATVKVPLDYAKPDGETIELALIRAKATQPARRIGSLVFNFGGPGASGVDVFSRAAPAYKNLNTRYDLVSFDPRGVGKSSPVTCVDDTQMDRMAAMDGSPDNAAEERALISQLLSYDEGCKARSGKVLPHVGTINAARDLDMIRKALGDRRLHYFGISYGTELGANYAHQFPKQVGRAVLDGAVDTKVSTKNLSLQQAAAFQRALGNYGAACAAPCPLGKDVVASVQKLLTTLDAKPLPTSGERKLTQSLGTTGVLTALYSKQLWPLLTQGVTEARQGKGDILLALADLRIGRDETGHYNNLVAANTAISCADTTDRYTRAEVREALPRFRKASPIFGPSIAWGMLTCTGWPIKGDKAAKEVSAPGAAPIMVVGNTGDPATPYGWAPALTKELGGSATLVTLKGEGHGAYDTGDRCIQRTVDAYLLDGKQPAKKTCP
ncbi:alpha/beta hydrolase [Actinomadura rudentiformis]|uniref:alpha/beta hydrolase n=1 Tax=Actinomadura rudentiformis TaxID=359158 RepID=UPI001CEF68E3|nr:alpha/beta hydrolase [Actinomadura rudentiformis]